jgi:hypothetical protein
MPVNLVVAEGQKILQDGQVFEEGQTFEAGDQNAESLVERGLAEKPKVGRPRKTDE